MSLSVEQFSPADHDPIPGCLLVDEPAPVTESNQFIFRSSAMHELVKIAQRAAVHDAPVLINGETGVGKELMARYIHLNSPCALRPMIAFNCAAIPRELFESQLFGYKQGAFTGAARGQSGIIRAAAGGTLLLDEVGELPLELQPKLLRFLQEGEVHPVGENQPTAVKVRVIALTNRDLEREVAAHRFRADLYYRLNVISLTVPPLRQRHEDIPVLVNFFRDKYDRQNGNGRRQFTTEALECLAAYHWPGNVRELSNVLLKLVTFTEHNATITLNDLPAKFHQVLPSVLPDSEDVLPCAAPLDPISLSPDMMLEEAIGRLERRYVRDALLRHDGNYSKAARQLGLSTFGLRKKYRRLFPEGGLDNSATMQQPG